MEVWTSCSERSIDKNMDDPINNEFLTRVLPLLTELTKRHDLINEKFNGGSGWVPTNPEVRLEGDLQTEMVIDNRRLTTNH